MAIELIGSISNEVPVFSEATLTRSIAENTPANTDIGAVIPEATDADGDRLDYSLEGTDAASFMFDSATRQIKTLAALDYEARSSYSVTVKADDGAYGTDTVDVTITVTDESEPPLKVAAPTAAAGLNESMVVSWTPNNDGRPPITNYRVKYRAKPGGAQASKDVPGTVTSTTIANLRTDREYRAQVRATNSDGDGEFSEWSAFVTPVSNSAPVFSDTTPERSLDENTGPNVDIGAAVTATDDTGDTLAYSLSGTDAASFAIDTTDGQLKTKSGVTYDHETKPSYTVVVMATDSFDDSSSATVTISVTDVNEPPAFSSPATFTPAENQTAVGTVRATDPDTADQVGSYAITGGADETAFEIVATTGVLSFSTAPDYEARSPDYSVTVRATGGTDTRVMTADQTITVTVTNVEEAGTVTLSSDQLQVGAAVTASLSDPDEGVTNLTWQWARSLTGTGSWTTISGATDAGYTPVDDDVNHYLRAMASYSDTLGSGRKAEAVSANKVRALDANLSGISVNGTAVPDFDPATTAYTVGVANAAATPTVVGTPAGSEAAVTCSTDANNMDGCQVDVGAGAGTVLTLTVTDGTLTKTYTVTINRGLTGAFQWKAADDIYGFVDPDGRLGRDLWSDGTTAWVADAPATGDEAMLYAFDLATGARDTANDIAIGTYGNTRAKGVFGLDGTIWVSNGGEPHKLFAYRKSGSTWGRAPEQDLTGLSFNLLFTGGIWSDGETWWVVHNHSQPLSKSLRAYNLSGGRDAAKDFNEIHTSNHMLTAIWSDGETMWVGDGPDGKIYAYNMRTKTHASSKEFRTTDLAVKGENVNPQGIWSDGATMWVVDVTENIYSYHMPVSNNANLRTLSLDGTEIEAFNRNKTSYAVTVPTETTQVTLAAATRHFQAMVDISPTDADLDTDGHQVNLSVGTNTVTLTVTAQNGSAEKTYTVAVTLMGLSMDATLSALTVDATPVSNFAPETTTYNYDVAQSTQRVTIAATPTDSTAMAIISPTDADLNTAGHQVDLNVGANPVTITVTAEDASTKVYTLTLTRPLRLGLTVDGTAVSTLDSDSTTPSRSVAKARVTIVATSNDSTAMVTYSVDDADDVAAGHQVDLAEGRNSVTITVTTQDGNTTEDYTLILTRRPSAPPPPTVEARNGGLFVTWQAPAGNGGTPVAYDLRYIETSADETDDDNWSVDQNVWTDTAGGPWSALLTGLTNGTPYDVQVRAWNSVTSGAWSDTRQGTPAVPMMNNASLSRLQVGSTAIPAFSGGRTEYTVGVAHSTVRVTIDAATVHGDAGVVIAPALDTDPATAGHQVNLAEGANTVTLEVTAANGTDTETYTLTLNRGSAAQYGWQAEADLDSLKAAGNEHLAGLWSDGTTLWVADSTDDKVYAYELATGRRAPHREFALASENIVPRGIWSDGTTLWVADSTRNKVYAYELATGARDAAKDFDTLVAAGNTNPTGLWANAETMWIADSTDDKVYAYTLATKASDTDAEFDLHSDQGDPSGLWSDGTTLWVADSTDNKVYAYTLATEMSDSTKEFGLSASGNEGPVGLWANTDTLWVADSQRAKVYAYRRVAATPPANAEPAFSSDTDTRSVNENTPAGEDIGAPIAATEDNAGDTLTYSLHGPDAASFDIVSTSGQLQTKAALDYETKDSYTVIVAVRDSKNYSGGADRALDDLITVTISVTDSPNEDDATLSGLTLSAGWLSPTFNKTTTAYTASVGYTVARLTVTPSPSASSATLAYFDGSDNDLPDADLNTAGHQVALDVGDENVIKVKVTSEDGNMTETYTVTVTRTTENLSLRPPASDPTTAYASTAVYTVKFEGKWNSMVTPGGRPGGAHFSPLIGGVHNDLATFLESGEEASPGIESMAELGLTAALEGEVTTAINADPPTALSVLSRSGNINPTRTVLWTDVTLTTAFPRVTLTTMIAPSHDWFVGVAGLLLLDADGRWLDTYEVDLFPWDAGTEDGDDFALEPNVDTDPRGVITSLRGTGPFTTMPIATLTFTRESVGTTRSLDENTGPNVDIGDPVTSPVPGSATVTYSLGGTHAESFSIEETTGQLKTKSDVTYDHETTDSYAVTVTATDTGSDPAVTTDIAVTIEVIDLEEAGTVSLSSLQPQVGTVLTASLDEADDRSGSTAWSWAQSDNSTGPWTPISGATSSSYTPQAADETKYLRATASYTDSHGAKTPSAVSANAVQPIPHMNMPPSFTEGSTTTRSLDENTVNVVNIGAAVTATDPDTGDTLTYSLGGTDVGVGSFDIDTTDGQLKTKSGVTYDHETTPSYTLEVTATDSSSATATIAVTISVTDLNEPPAFSSPAAFTVAENQTAVGPVKATDPDTADEVGSYAITGGADRTAFEIGATTGVLSFITAPDYEARSPAYSVTVTATGGTDTREMTAPQTITVTVTNEEEAGTVTLSSDEPEIDTAVTASLSDPDGGVTTLTWQWARSTTDTGPWTDIDTATDTSYTPVAADVNHYLRATASYDDAHGPDKSAAAVSDKVPSVTASLSAISVNGTDIADFDPAATTPYIVGVGSTEATATISATPTDEDATVTYSGDGTDVTDGHQVTFTTADNSFDITITVTAADELTTGTYTVTVRRGVTTAPGWRVDDDIDLDIDSDTSDLRGIWSDGTTLWVAVADAAAGKLFAYTLATGARVAGRDITLDSANAEPTGIWSDGTTIWVADADAGTLYAYTLATRMYDADKNIELDSANADPTDLWSDGTTLWVADATDTILYAYTLPDGSEGSSSKDSRTGVGKSDLLPRLTDVNRDSSKDIDLADANADPTGIWSDGVTMWVADATDATLYAYSLEDRSPDSTKDFEDPRDAGNTSPFGLWSDGETLWGADTDATKLFSYTLPKSDNAELRSILVKGEAASGTGTGYTHTVANDVAQVTVEPQVLQLTAKAEITSPADADLNTADHQVDLNAGANPIAITVTAQDGMTTEDYTLTITRTNSPPVFTVTKATRSIMEHTGTGTDNIGAPLTATDADNNPLTYSLGGTDGGSFTIDATNGQLKTKKDEVYDYEMPADANNDNDYEVTVTATDTDTFTTATIAVTITVTNVNEPGQFVESTVRRSVAENTAAGVDIGNPVEATDPDTTNLTYRLGGTDVAFFDIDDTNGQLRTKTGVVYDYETKKSYEVTMLVTDGQDEDGNPSTDPDATIAVTITVTDANEAGTVSLAPDQPQALTPLTASLDDPDRDSGPVTWQWEWSDNSTGPWTAASGQVSSSGVESEYTPVAGDAAKYLRATASYTDRLSPDQTAEKISGQVQAAPVVELVLSSATIDEDGGTSTVTARLTGGTSGSDTVVTLVDPPEFDLSGTTLTIPAGGTTSTETVTLTATDNDVDDDASRTVDVTGSTPNLQVTGPAAVPLTLTDDDTRGVTLSRTTLSVHEGDNETYTVVLDSEPTAPVTVMVAKTVDSSEDVSVRPPSLTFTAVNWKTTQTVTVEAAHDSGDGDQDDMATITHTVSGGDYGDNGVTADNVAVTVEDDEADSTEVTLTVSPDTVNEGASRTVTVTGKLNGRSLPGLDNAVVAVTVTSGTATAGTDFAVVPGFNLTITAGLTEGTATFDLTPTNDTIDEPDETVMVGGSNADLDVNGTELTIEDNDAPPTVVLMLSDTSIDEDGGVTTVTAELTGGTTSSVATEVEVSATPVLPATNTDFTLTGTTLTIAAETTTSADTVTLTATENTEDGPHKTVEVSGQVVANDTLADPDAVALTISDDDPPEVTGPATPPAAYTERADGPVATYTATRYPEDITITWGLDGDDKGLFNITNGVLSFKASPNFEDLVDNDSDNAYEVSVTASDGPLTSEPLPVTVTVIDAPGRLSLSPATLQVGQAVTATLTDPDDPDGPTTDHTWVWERSLDPSDPDPDSWEPLTNTTHSYTPRAGDAHHYLRVTVGYTDGAGTPKTGVQIVSEDPVEQSQQPPRRLPLRGGGGGGGGGGEPEPETEPVGYLENPGPDSFQSGVGVISGWVCDADLVEIEIDDLPAQVAAYGTERGDTLGICGDTNNGFGLLFNWNLLGDGEHTVVAYVDDVELGRATVQVTTLGAEFLRGAAGECVMEDFPMPGETVTLVWQQTSQNFVIAGGSPPAGDNAPRPDALTGFLENPGRNSFQSGVGVLSGWVCEADTVALAIGTAGRQVAAYGTERGDTLDTCGDTDNGFGLLFNWNLLGDGEHTVVAYVDDEELGRATVQVTTLGAEFLRGAAGECVVEGFPMLGETVVLEWQQNSQNFVITDVE